MIRMARRTLVGAWLATAGIASAAELTGNITDSDGGALPGANITVTGAGLDRAAGAVSGASGEYVVRGLAAGDYKVRITHIGFQTTSRGGVSVGASGASLDITLEPVLLDLELSVVTASRTQERALDAPASISVVEADDIATRSVLTVSGHVRDQPGIDFAQTGLVQGNIVARGFNNIFSGALLTLTDNRIANVPSLRVNVHNFIPVTNEDIERIEVVLGPGSALYGPNSANGVLHIISRSPFESAGSSVTFGGGERGLVKGSFRHAGVVNPYLAYKISAQYYTGEDWNYTDPIETALRQSALATGASEEDLLIGARDFDVQRRSLEARVDFQPTEDLTAIVSYGYNQGDHIELTGLGAGQGQDWASNYVQTRFLYQDWFAQYYHNWSDAQDTYLLRSGEPIIDKSTMDVFQLQHTAGLGDRHSFTYGVDALFTRPATKGTITGGNEDDDDIDEYGAYLQGETALRRDLDLVLALRYDTQNRLDDPEYSPRAALVYKLDDSQSLRFTYNRAFSTPTTNNLYLDLLAQEGAFAPLEAFAPVLGFSPNVDVRAQGTYRKGFDEGFTFRRSADGRPMYRTSFQPVLSSVGMVPGGAGSPVDADGYIALDDPFVTNVQWGIGRNAVLAQFGPALEALAPGLIAQQLIAAGMDAADAQAAGQAQAAVVAAALPSLVPEQLPGLTNAFAKLNLETLGFDPVADAFDVPRSRSTITQTLELGYKGIVGKKLVVSADLYRTDVEDFVGPLAVETPNVFLDPTVLGGVLGTAFGQALADPANGQIAPVLAALDQVSIPGVSAANNNGTAADELATIFAAGAAQIPYGTMSPVQAYDPTAVILTYRNFGDVTLYGLDLALGYYATENLSFNGSYSFVNDDLFENLGGVSDVALNAPKHKVKVGTKYSLPQYDLRLGARLRYNGEFPMDSGVYVGAVDSYTTLDLSARYELPVGDGLYLLANIDNTLDERYRAFIGAPEVGRMAYVQVGADF
ncbi:MAG: hypothetical protein CME04_23855 [Gemmatimonadaceae bacterium]|jgi:iron complex outermembrane receptor protein|nr:hypothetical protein [Gemmatimonadaceae bacterium]